MFPGVQVVTERQALPIPGEFRDMDKRYSERAITKIECDLNGCQFTSKLDREMLVISVDGNEVVQRYFTLQLGSAARTRQNDRSL